MSQYQSKKSMLLTDAEVSFSRREFSKGIIGRVSYWIFNFRRTLLLAFVLLTLLFGYTASHLKVESGFLKMIPLKHEYMQSFFKYQSEFGGANRVMIALHNTQGDIYSKEFMETLKKVSDEVFFIKGIERSSVTSLFTSNVRYSEVVEDGFVGGNIVASDFMGTPEQLNKVRDSVLKSDWIGRIVSNDFQSSMVVANLQDIDPATGERVDLQTVAKSLEDIRSKYEKDGVTLHIIGFAKSVGDIAEGASGVMLFFLIAFVLTAVLLYWYSGSFKLAALAMVCALVPVIWLLGALPLLGLALDPMSILVPFLIFSIGVSHAVQMTNAWKLETLHGHDGVTASRNCFQKLFIPGAMALLANALGFMVIAFVQIEMVQELAIAATLGVSLMILTNKVLLPILLSYLHLTGKEVSRFKSKATDGDGLWEHLGPLATRKGGAIVLLVALIALGWGLWEAGKLKVGDTGQGVPELRGDSRYNQDVAMITRHFSIGVDLLQVVVEATGKDSPCIDREVMGKIDDFEFAMRQTDGISAVRGLASYVSMISQANAETFIKWRTIPEDSVLIAQGVGYATRLGSELMNSTCTAMPISLYLADHQASTINHIIERIKAFKAANETDRLKFQLASGNVGVMAASNEAVAAADKWVNFALFGSVALLCLLTFRSLRITLCIILPLALVTVLCNALMARLGIGVKVNTLPVVALGVGVGVDYGIYLFERIKHEMHSRGHDLRAAFVAALKQRGTASLFTAVTMTLSVTTWVFSSLKFQADMGVLLAFMFLVNVFGAILLLPALAAWLIRPVKVPLPKPHLHS